MSGLLISAISVISGGTSCAFSATFKSFTTLQCVH